MHWLFLIPLATGLMSGYLSYCLLDEIAYLTGALAAICLILCLLIAPWQIQLLILVFGFIAARTLWLKIQRQVIPQMDNLIDNIPQRTYRGIPYATDIKEEIAEQDYKKEGTYRGKHWESNNTVLEKAENTKFIRKYRGIPLGNPDINEQ